MADRKEIINMTTVAILTAPAQQVSIDQQELEQLLTPPLLIGQSPEGLLISSQKDQIEVITGGIKTNVRDLSGKKPSSKNKIPAILDFFVQRLGLQVNSYGVNFLIAMPCMGPEKWIIDNIFSSNVYQKTDKKLVGGVAIIKVESGQKIWNIKFEPKGNQTISIDFNASECAQLPDQKGLSKELQEQLQALLEFLNALGLK